MQRPRKNQLKAIGDYQISQSNQRDQCIVYLGYMKLAGRNTMSDVPNIAVKGLAHLDDFAHAIQSCSLEWCRTWRSTLCDSTAERVE